MDIRQVVVAVLCLGSTLKGKESPCRAPPCGSVFNCKDIQFVLGLLENITSSTNSFPGRRGAVVSACKVKFGGYAKVRVALALSPSP